MKKHKPFGKHGPRNSKAPRFKQKKKKGMLEKTEITLLESSKAKVRSSSKVLEGATVVLSHRGKIVAIIAGKGCTDKIHVLIFVMLL